LAGIPIVTTKLPYIAGELAQKGSGIVIPYQKDALVHALSSLLTDKKKLIYMRKLARQMAESYNWNTLFDVAFQSL
jgi:glycosyltransferase involved in cell wall biosynthesis